MVGREKRKEFYENDMTSKRKRQGKPSQVHMCFLSFVKA
jgi:hypothetical protein